MELKELLELFGKLDDAQKRAFVMFVSFVAASVQGQK